MENGSFQLLKSDLSKIDFEESLPPTPNQPANSISRTTSTSSTVETLIAQNQDLASRQNVTLRRLATIEGEYEKLRCLFHQVETENSSLTDQLLVWKEKETYWSNKIQTHQQELAQVRARFPEFESMEEKLERYKKYHEKIRTQVKPYIQQLKLYAQNLTVEIRNLNNEVEIKTNQIYRVEEKLKTHQREIETQFQQQNEQTRKLIALFEDEKQKFEFEIQNLRQTNLILEDKASRLDASLLRQDELENTIIAMNRLRDESTAQQEKSQLALNKETEQLKKELIEEKLKNKELTTNLKALTEESERQRHRADQNQEQLSSLRYLWTNKCSELEKLKLSQEALEKLNQELSTRLNQLRRGEATL